MCNYSRSDSGVYICLYFQVPSMTQSVSLATTLEFHSTGTEDTLNEDPHTPRRTRVTTASTNDSIDPQITPVYPPNAPSSEYIRAQASMSAQSEAHLQNACRIIALESVVSRISTQVSSNDESLKQVLESQNFMARLLMRCVNSESATRFEVEVRPSLKSVLNQTSKSFSAPADDPIPAVNIVPPTFRSPSGNAECIPASNATGDCGETHQLNLSTPSAATSPVGAAIPTVDGENSVPVQRNNLYRSPALSWRSGSTILITPSMDLRDPGLRDQHCPTAVSAEVSDSIRNPLLSRDPLQPFLDVYHGPGRSWMECREKQVASSGGSVDVESVPPTFTGSDKPQTRQAHQLDSEDERRKRIGAEKLRHGMLMMPRLSEDPIVCNKACYILHPDFTDAVVVEGRSGGSWKAKTLKLGHLCGKDEQMVQVHSIKKPDCRLLHIEDGQN
ncbi:hypothetical protein KC19_VG229200 [Ceratodon purpureus]|uniref:Uncharacterized protein n=1 Tax=Ceratodon purpureus TaxID=3225 RepID=A0A8T0HU35_CERPU|nr:hypothetical protein KC19_VG229200 [Ceratodon purpureus]